MRVSAVIPAYRAVRYLKNCVESLLAQSQPLQEIIIVDDHGPDNTWQIAEALAKEHSKVRLLRNERNMGPSHSRNYGVQEAKSPWILFLDSDDYVLPNLVERHFQRLQELEPSAQGRWILSFCPYQRTDESGTPIPDSLFAFKQVMPEELLGYLFVRNHIPVSGTMVRKEKFLEAGGFSPEVRFAEDWELWLRMAHLGGAAYVEDPLVKVRRHEHNLSSSITPMQLSIKHTLRNFEPSDIKEAIFRRRLSDVENQTDYVRVLFDKDLWAEGEQILRGILDKMPGWAPAHFLFGLAQLKKGETVRAKIAFQACLEHDPLNAAAMNNIGALLLVRGELAIGRKFCKQALATLPGYMDAIENLECPPKELKNAAITWRPLRPSLEIYKR